MTRLATGLLVNALVRRVQDDGGHAMVLAKGDADSGAILIVAVERGQDPQCWERGWDEQGRAALVATGPRADPAPGGGAEPPSDSAVTDYWRRRRERDRDLWVVELDSAQAKRFAAETILTD